MTTARDRGVRGFRGYSLPVNLTAALRYGEFRALRLPPAWTFAAAYLAIQVYLVTVAPHLLGIHLSLIGDDNVAFQPANWLNPLSDVVLFVSAFVLGHNRREHVVPLIAVGLVAQLLAADDQTVGSALASDRWWFFSVPPVVVPALAGLGLAVLSVGARRGQTADGDRYWIPRVRPALVALITLQLLAFVPLLLGTEDGISWARFPLFVASTLVYPALFAAAFALAKPTAALLAVGLASADYVVTAMTWLPGPCINQDGDSTSCAAQLFWVVIHRTVPSMLLTVALALLAVKATRARPKLPPVPQPAT